MPWVLICPCLFFLKCYFIVYILKCVWVSLSWPQCVLWSILNLCSQQQNADGVISLELLCHCTDWAAGKATLALQPTHPAGMQWQELWNWPLTACGAKVQNKWSCAFIPLYMFMACTGTSLSLALALPTQPHTPVKLYQTTRCHNPDASIYRKISLLTLPTNCMFILCMLSSRTKNSEVTLVCDVLFCPTIFMCMYQLIKIICVTCSVQVLLGPPNPWRRSHCIPSKCQDMLNYSCHSVTSQKTRMLSLILWKPRTSQLAYCTL